MRRRTRLAWAIGTGIGSVALVLGLIRVGSVSEGPISFATRQVGSWIGRAESATIQRMRGPGRASELEWIGHLRSDADSLRDPRAMLFGAYTEGVAVTLEGIVDLERSLGTTFPLIQLYTAWGDDPEQQFPRREVDAIAAIGSIPVVTWEPWLATFEARLHPHLPLPQARDRGVCGRWRTVTTISISTHGRRRRRRSADPCCCGSLTR